MTYATTLKKAAKTVLERIKPLDNSIGKIQTPSLPTPPRTTEQLQVKYIQDSNCVDKAIKFLLSQNITLGIDIETYPTDDFKGDKYAGLDPYRSNIRLVQFSCENNLAFVFDLLKIGGIHKLERKIWNKSMIAHNAVFELKHLFHNGIFPSQMGCTMLLANALYGGKLRSLKNLSEEVFKIVLSKDQQISDWRKDDLNLEQVEYAAKDAIMVFRLFHNLYPPTPKKKLLFGLPFNEGCTICYCQNRISWSFF